MARPKGSLNTHSKILKEMVMAALEAVGGENYLEEQAIKNPTAFMTLLGKTLPIGLDITKTNITVNVGYYPEIEHKEQIIDAIRPEITQEAVHSTNQPCN